MRSSRARLLSALAAGLLGAVPAVPARAALAADVPAPVVAYDFDADDPAGTVIADRSGNGLDGTLVNGSTAAVVDGSGGGHALQLPGGASTSTGAYVSLPRAVLDGRTDLTVSVRVRWDGTAAPWQWIYALGQDNTRFLFTTPYSGDGRVQTGVWAPGATGVDIKGYGPLPADAWKTLTVTLDTAADRVTSYLDGAQITSGATTVSAADLLPTSGDVAGFIGKSFFPDPLFDGAVDDFRVYGAALTAEQVAAAAGVTPPTVTGISATTFDVRTTIGTAPALPATVRAQYSDGYDRDLPITWAAVDSAQYAQRGTFEVTGTAAGRAVTATVTVIREGEMTIDLSKSTGAFHGGASGTLYGLYGAGVPTNNLIEGMHLRTVSTKAQDGPQHPGADALEVVQPLADSTDGDVYIYMTDIYRGFPYEWPGSTPQEKLDGYKAKIATQVDQVKTLDPKYQDNVVFVPFNEP
ncbi:MAG TPA: LamG-like jellyroll fold domain-containing protein, partial [Actinoplanes sp.]